ncbi:MAG: hypothetical protein M0R74_18815 [Dehalococcoidia bacterium]|jgi:hypothetical protein|nr:hypothetical protein [Dehalococcoidia bacterium]
METILSTLSILPSNKEQVFSFVKTLKSEILSNDRDPLKVLVQLKMIEKAIADILKDDEVDYHFLKEYLQYEKEGSVALNGAVLRKSEVGVKYDYDACGDPLWNDLNKQEKELSEKRKEREKFLQNIPWDKGIVDPDTGVFITRAPKHSKEKVVVKI